MYSMFILSFEWLQLQMHGKSSLLSLSFAVVLVTIIAVRHVFSGSKKLPFPIVGSINYHEMKKDSIEGALKYPNEPFILPSSPPVVILPECVFDEVRNLPESIASFMQVVKTDFNYRHTSLGQERPEVIAAVKEDLTKNIDSVVGCLQDEVKYGFEKEIGPCSEWTPVPLYRAMIRTVALMSSRVFVGLPLSREEEWLQATINFTTYAVAASDVVRGWNIFLRPFVAPFLGEIRRVKRYKDRGGELLAPFLRQKLEEIQNGKLLVPFEQERFSFIGWILKHTKENERRNSSVMGLNQMTLSLVAIHTTSMAITHAIFDLASRPEYIQPLRDEITEVIKQDGHGVTDATKRLKRLSIPKLKKLDSFIRESQRMSTSGLFIGARVAMQPIHLSTGHTIPTGTKFAVNSWAIHHLPSSQTFSPAYNPPRTYKPPNEFDGYRFYKLRQMPGKENKHQYTSTAPNSLTFGHGSHTCPGRHFAGYELKVILIELLMEYDVRCKGDIDGKGGEDMRPPDILSQAAIYPNPFAELKFKKRTAEVI
ncbi:cytochrome P450 [Amylocarpus encephaloides]|uniref:Cytochrome P450 n=1 Tax=Amylocarpus encephaloides TaxID=45428 RepID=A0A9P7YNB4_9HELO|nr:cytochrome P450 [Amylocarpus encephaloides]